MQVIVSGRHFQVSDELKNYANEALSRLSTEYAKLTTGRVVLEFERSWNVAEVHVQGKSVQLDATARTQDMYTAIDQAVEKVEKQLAKRLGRRMARRGEKPEEEEGNEETDELDEVLNRETGRK